MSARRAWLGRTPVRRPTARHGGFKVFHLGSFSNRLGSRAVNIILDRPFAARGCGLAAQIAGPARGRLVDRRLPVTQACTLATRRPGFDTGYPKIFGSRAYAG